jgi:hypothetical protein
MMVRMVVGVAVLLLAAFVLLNLGKKQAEALRPASAGASVPGSAANLPEKYKQDFQKAMQQGMEQRASEPAP